MSPDMFDLLGPLPAGTTVLEASAGSGKTYTIVGLATRYVAEGVAELSQLMLVTFSRAATQELREKTRERFTSAAAGLADPAAARRGTDQLIARLAMGSDHEVANRRQRLGQALSNFDAATIATTHSFCQRMLDGLGIAGERDPDVTVVESIDDLVSETVGDLYLREFAGYSGADPALSLAEAGEAARAAVADRQAVLAPLAADPGSAAGQRVGIATAARAEVERRKRAMGVRDFDDLLVMLRDTLTDPTSGAAACERIRERYRVVLVDEFQDTDPVQWEILRSAFHGHSTLVLVGDPKQAIYAFRGAEVLSYLDAVKVAGQRHDLAVNWRSDRGLVTAVEHLYGGAALGHDDIVVRPVRSEHQQSRLAGQTPFRLRYLGRRGAGALGKNGFPFLDALRAKVAADMAADLARLLRSGSALDIDGTKRPIEPGDIAVLVRKGIHIPFIKDALDGAGVPSVQAGGSSVFETRAAIDWLALLRALEQPHRADRIRLAALTPLVGRTSVQLADAAGDDLVARVGGQLREWAALFERSGLAAVFEALAAQTRLEGRLLAVDGGDRRVTDLRHVAQLLNGAAVDGSLGLTALTRWLDQRIKDPLSWGTKDRSRRLESDAAAVQIVTVHGSKGLEFPVVYLPYAWDGAKNPKPPTLLFHTDEGERTLDVGGPDGPGYLQRKSLDEKEAAGEELRLLYVALTRAMCQVVLWWAPSYGTAGSALQRFLMGRTPGTAQPILAAKVPEDPAVTDRLSSWATGFDDFISVEPVAGKPVSGGKWQSADDARGSLEAARFDRELDLLWRRTSYSALTVSAHEAPGVGSEVEAPEKSDEPIDEPLSPQAPDGPASLMNGLPAGAAFGTLVHEVLEVVDTATADLPAEVLRRCQEAIGARLAQVEPSALAIALLGVLHTPLGFGTLASIAPQDRLAELDFELPLAGGDHPAAADVTLLQVASLLRRHLPTDDPLAPYPDLLHTLDAPPLRGFLVGSIDAVLRISGPVYVIVDYKTNRLAQGDLTALNFTRERMAAEMMRSHYPLQALIYSVALHRYLRWRQPGYDPSLHLGGVQYQFVRGMVGPETPAGCGVFDWKPPPELVTELSDLLAGW